MLFFDFALRCADQAMYIGKQAGKRWARSPMVGEAVAIGSSGELPAAGFSFLLFLTEPS